MQNQRLALRKIQINGLIRKNRGSVDCKPQQFRALDTKDHDKQAEKLAHHMKKIKLDQGLSLELLKYIV